MRKRTGVAAVGIFSVLLLVAGVLIYKYHHAAVKPPPPKPAAPAPVKKSGLETACDPSETLDARILGVKGLGRNLPPEDVARVKELLFRRGENETLRNECGTTLLHQSKPVDILDELVASHQDMDESRKWRDYSSQFISRFYMNGTEEARVRAVDALVETIDGADPELTSTAMISLQRIGDVDPSVRRLSTSMSSAHLNSSNPTVANTALNLAIQRGDKLILPMSRKRAQTSKDMRMRLSSIAAIGRLGGAEDEALLKKLAGDKDSRVRRVAAHQLAELQRRLTADAAAGQFN